MAATGQSMQSCGQEKKAGRFSGKQAKRRNPKQVGSEVRQVYQGIGNEGRSGTGRVGTEQADRKLPLESVT